MPNPPGFWAALRLTAFVNCEISEANWRTLWSEPPRSFRPAVHPRETAARPGYVPDDLRGAIWASINLEGGRGPREWEVRGAHEGIATLRAIRLQDAEAFIRRRGPIEESPYRPWPRHGRERRGLRYERLKAIHQTTRERLAAVCADAWQPLFKTFGWRRRFHSVATLRFYRHPQFGSVPVLVPDLEPNLELHLDRLFLDTLVNGLWVRFYRCEGCGYFGVRERAGQRSRQLCDRSKCRVARHRAKQKAEQDALRTKVRAAFRMCREPDRTEVVRRQFGLTPAEINRLLR